MSKYARNPSNPGGFSRYTRRVPSTSSTTNSASFRIFRCCEIAGRLTGKPFANFPTGIFTAGPTQLLAAGPDGLVGTTDDVNYAAALPCPAGPECVVLPGPDGILGTADDVAMSLSNFTRTIAINSVLEADGVTIDPNLKQIAVTVSYIKPGMTVPRSYTVSALISTYR